MTSRTWSHNITRIGAAFLMAGMLAKSGMTTPGTSISGTPAAPTHISLNTAYSIHTQVDANVCSSNASDVELYSDSTPTGPWTFKASYAFSGGGPIGNKTFNVVNQANDTWYWKADGYCTGTGFGSAIDGAWETP